MSIQPSAGAFTFVVDDATTSKQFDIALDIIDYDGFSDWDMRFRPTGSSERWAFISFASKDNQSFNPGVKSGLNNEELTAAEMQRIITQVNIIVAEKFGAQTRPNFGNGLLRFWLKSGALSELNNVLTFKAVG